jgi:GxxExxY protein
MAGAPDGADDKFLYPDEIFRIRGAIFEVNRVMGAGFLEAVYQECLAIEFGARGIPFTASPFLALTYKGRELQKAYVPDFVCYGKIILELKALTSLAAEHRAQVLNYLRASRMKVGLLANFGSSPKAQIERLVMSQA